MFTKSNKQSVRALAATSVLAVTFAAANTAAAEEETAPAAGDAVVLDEIVVSASRVPMKASKVGSTVTVITAEELEERGDRYVSDVLRDVPGLSVSRTGSFGALTEIYIRGTEADHTLVVVDGVEINDPSSGSKVDFGELLISDIERIEILRGSQSALWGSDAIGGVINIVTKKGKGDINGFVSAEGGSFGSLKSNAAIRGGNDWVHGSLALSKYKTNGISQADESLGNSEEDGHEAQSANAKLGFTPTENLTIDLFGRYNHSFLQTDSFVGGVGAVDADQDSETHQRYGMVSAKYDLFDGAWTHQLRAAYSQDDSNYRTNKATTFNATGSKEKYDYQTTTRFETPDVAKANHVATLLLEREVDEIDTTSLTTGAVEVETNSIALEYNLSLWGSLHLSASGRHDDNDTFKDANTYRLTAAYEIKNWGGRLHTSFGTGVKNPTLTQLYGFSGNFVGNPDLTPESNEGWDVGYEQIFWDDRAAIDVTYFKNKVDDLIVGSGNTAVNLNGISPAEGIEVGLDVDLTDNLLLAASYTYTNAETADGTEQVRRARHIASMNLNYAFLDDRANVNLGVDFNGAQKDFEFDSSWNRSIVELGSYTLVNLQGRYDVTENVELFARGENLLDEDYQEVLTYGTPGISAYAGMKVKF